MKIVWSRRAVEHLIAVRAYIAKDNPQAAGKVAMAILKSVERLTRHPNIGGPGRVSGSRELTIAGTPYVLPYRIREGKVEIIAVFHGKQRWPKSF